MESVEAEAEMASEKALEAMQEHTLNTRSYRA